MKNRARRSIMRRDWNILFSECDRVSRWVSGQYFYFLSRKPVDDDYGEDAKASLVGTLPRLFFFKTTNSKDIILLLEESARQSVDDVW